MPDNESKNVAVSSLPFYGEAATTSYAARPEEDSLLRDGFKVTTLLRDGFKVTREAVTEVVGVARNTRDAVNHVVDTGAAHSSAAYFQVKTI